MNINVIKTVEKILEIEPNFKVLIEDEITGGVTLSTPVDDNFNRMIIIVEHQMIACGSQGLNSNEKLVTLFDPVPVKIIQAVEYIVPSKTVKKKVK